MVARRWLLLLAVLVGIALLAAGCAAGSDRFAGGPAGFWAGLWHGCICVVAFIVSLFVDGVRIYEVRNTGHLYDLGFVIGALVCLGGIARPHRAWRLRRRRLCEREMDDVTRRVEERVRLAVKRWAEEAAEDEEWRDIGKRVEEKIKKELRKWAES